MTTNYPATLDTTAELKNDTGDGTVTSNTHAAHHNNISDALIAIETEMGVSLKGSFADLTAKLAAYLYKTPATAQVIRATGDFIPMALRQHASQSAAKILVGQDEAGAEVVSWDRTGLINAAGFRVGGVDLASTHLSDTAALARNPSPSLVTPSISSPDMTGVPISTTAGVDNDSTRIATTAYVKNQGYVTLNNPVFTGNPTAPTQAQGNDSTRIATTAYVATEIIARQTSPAPSGSIVGFSGSSIPSGWLLCDGSSVSRTTYADLFTAIGTAYGSVDGNSFTLPDFRGRFAVGLGTHADVNSLSDNDGQSTVSSRRPSHAHTFSITSNTQSHSHSGSFDSASNHSHSGTGCGSQGNLATGGTANPATQGSVNTDSQGDHGHSGSIPDAGHGHSMTGTVGTAGMTDKPAYLTTNYMIKT